MIIQSQWIPDGVWRVAMMTYHREIRRNPDKAWQLAVAAALTTWPENAWHSKDINAPYSYLVLPFMDADT